MSELAILQLSALAVLVTYLCVSLHLRRRDAWRQRREDWTRAQEFRKQWQTTALDSSSISRQLQLLRRDYVSAVRSRPRQSDNRSRLLGSMRAALLRSPYFQNLEDQKSASHECDTHKLAA